VLKPLGQSLKANINQTTQAQIMITVSLKPVSLEQPRTLPFVLAVFSFRYDVHLVPDMLANIDPLIDGWVSFDDRASSALFSDEPARRHALLVAARDAGAQWVLAVDPDERFEASLTSAMPTLLAAQGTIAYSFANREMYDTEHYRIDGLWGKKTQTRLFRMSDDIVPSPTPLHSLWHYMIPNAEVRDSGFNIYHLKMISSTRRRARADLYNHLDPNRQFQPIGYDYLADEQNAVFEKIPESRGYQPPHHEDDGLWMPAIARQETVVQAAPSPATSILNRWLSYFSRSKSRQAKF
jgi:hypothetical protein